MKLGLGGQMGLDVNLVLNFFTPFITNFVSFFGYLLQNATLPLTPAENKN